MPYAGEGPQEDFSVRVHAAGEDNEAQRRMLCWCPRRVCRHPGSAHARGGAQLPFLRTPRCVCNMHTNHGSPGRTAVPRASLHSACKHHSRDRGEGHTALHGGTPRGGSPRGRHQFLLTGSEASADMEKLTRGELSRTHLCTLRQAHSNMAAGSKTTSVLKYTVIQ